jgi:hypothetical protein
MRRLGLLSNRPVRDMLRAAVSSRRRGMHIPLQFGRVDFSVKGALHCIRIRGLRRRSGARPVPHRDPLPLPQRERRILLGF